MSCVFIEDCFQRFECRNSPNPVFKNHSTFSEGLFTSTNVFTGFFSETLGYFQFIKEKNAAGESVEKCSQINNTSNQKLLITGNFEEMKYQKCFWEKSSGKEY